MIEQKLITLCPRLDIQEHTKLQPYLDKGWQIVSIDLTGAGREREYNFMMAVLLERYKDV